MPEFEDSILPLLASPKTSQELKLEGSLLSSTTKNEQFPLCGSIPWLFLNPGQSWAEWVAKISQSFQSLEAEISSLSKSIADKKAISSTKNRIKLILNGKKEHLKNLKQLLLPILQNSPVQDSNLANAFWGKFPAQQQIFSYERNIFRDWAWDAEENDRTLDLFSKVCQRDKQALGKTLFVGAGSCRFPIDVHRAFKPELSIACDLNPFLFLLAEKMISQQSITLFEFPHPALDANQACIKHTLKDKQSKLNNFHLIFCDILKPPFKPNQFDTVITPWFIDIVQIDLKILVKIINQLLKPGGQWINLGPLLFSNCEPQGYYTFEEVKHIASKAGLDLERHEWDDLPYLNSPYSSHKRFERVYSWVAKKQKDSPLVKVENQSHLPSWLLDPKEAIPKSNFFDAFRGTHQTYFETVAMIDGSTSLKDIAEKLASKNNQPVESMQASVYRFFYTIFEQHKDSMNRGLG